MKQNLTFHFKPDTPFRKFKTFGKVVFKITCLFFAAQMAAQQPDTLPNKDAIFHRPFILEGERGNLTAAVGGYLEANTNYFATDGVSEGFSMEMRRFNIFLYSTLAERIKFISELEFEHGVEEIALETALLDFEMMPELVFRAGIVLVPLGYFNQNHDSPKWDFIDRPLVSTTLIPSTYSDVGFGLHGTISLGGASLTYETCLLNGLQDGILANDQGLTFLPGGKNEERFGEDNNGSPSAAARIALKKRKLGEFGISTFAGYFNTFKADGLVLDEKRTVVVVALDYNFSIQKLKVLGEAALVRVDVPEGLGQAFGKKQWGVHADLIYPFWKGNFLKWKDVQLNAAFRFEWVDYNIGEFEETGRNIGDDVAAIVPGVSLRFSPNTLLRVNYRYRWDTDLAGNPPARTAGFQFGLASYF